MGERNCPIARAVDVLDGKWTLLVMRELLTGVRRFGELRDALPSKPAESLRARSIRRFRPRWNMR